MLLYVCKQGAQQENTNYYSYRFCAFVVTSRVQLLFIAVALEKHTRASYHSTFTALMNATRPIIRAAAAAAAIVAAAHHSSNRKRSPGTLLLYEYSEDAAGRRPTSTHLSPRISRQQSSGSDRGFLPRLSAPKQGNHRVAFHDGFHKCCPRPKCTQKCSFFCYLMALWVRCGDLSNFDPRSLSPCECAGGCGLPQADLLPVVRKTREKRGTVV